MASAFQNEQHSAPDPSPASQVPLGLGTSSGIISTGSTGHIASESWRNTLTLYLSVTAADPPPCRLNSCHYELEKCWIGEAIRIWRETLQHCFEASKVSVWVNTEQLEPADDFTYLGHTIAYNNIDWAAVYHNLRKDQKRWRIIYKVLTKTGAMVQTRGMLYKSLD